MSDLKIIGNQNPVVGEVELYTVSDTRLSPIPQFGIPQPNKVFEPEIKWTVHVLDRGNWRKTKENDKTGLTVPYTFFDKSLTRKGLRIMVERAGEHDIIDIKPQKAEQAKIVKIVLLNSLGKEATKPFAYGQTFIARVFCVNMELRPVTVTLWEDDSIGAGHNPANSKIVVKTGNVFGGRVDIEFNLSPDMVKIANARLAKGDSDEGKTHEYYVTAEIFYKEPKILASINTDVANPDYKPTISKPKPPSPASTKGKSKKEEKGIPSKESVIHDHHETTVSVLPIISLNPMEAINSVMKVFMPDAKDENTELKATCACKDYNLIWGNKINCDERKKVMDVSKNLGVDPNWLMAVIALETAKTFDPSIDNGIGYVGLIQFGDAAANTVETTRSKLIKMGFIEQMDYVQKFLLSKKDKYKTLVDLYLAVLYPSACGHGNEKDYIVLSEKAYRNNPLFFQEEDEITKNKKGKVISRHPKAKGHTYIWEVNLAIQAVFTQGLLFKTTIFTCSSLKMKEEESICNCAKKHIDLRSIIKWHSQFDSQWGDKKAQNIACWKASQQILINSGLGSKSGYSNGAIQLAKETNSHTKIDYLINNLKEGIKYIDEQLEKSNPVLVGVNHDLNYHGEKNNDHTTDHFVVIVGRSCNNKGAFYTFYEVGTIYKKSGTSDDNKLYILSDRIEGKTSYKLSKLYQVAQVRKNN